MFCHCFISLFSGNRVQAPSTVPRTAFAAAVIKTALLAKLTVAERADLTRLSAEIPLLKMENVKRWRKQQNFLRIILRL
jgi:hypothetical protein